MRKDVKTGMLAGTVLCIVGVIWFCAKQQIVTSPLTKLELQKLAAPVNDQLPVVLAAQNKPQTQKPAGDTETLIIHTVTAGQNLRDISKIYYNTPGSWKKIYEANKEQLPAGPDMIKVGMRLVIPQ
jgi:nucleoid-associated protein YgaU